VSATELDLDIVAWLAKHQHDADDPQALADAVAEARRLTRERNAEVATYMPAALVPDSEVQIEIDGPDGVIDARVLRPAGDGPKPTIVYFHGGGWTVGDIDTHLGHARRICTQADAVVVSVAYRLAPEHRFPAAFDDAAAATEWVAQHIDELGGDAARLVVAGDSVGGQLAASVAIARRDAGLALAAQLLLYPVTDVTGLYYDTDTNAGYSSRKTAAEGYGLTLSDMTTFSSHYVDEQDASDWRVSPLRRTDLEGVAPAVVHVATHDVLRTEGNYYAQALQRAGVQVTSREFRTLNHSYFGLGGVSPIADAAAGQAADDLRALLYG
jgi:acetyl esterase